MESAFSLDQRLRADTLPLGDFALSRVLLMNDSRYRWIILVPRRAGVSEWIDLGPQDGRCLWEESMQVCHVLRERYVGDKLNVAALGNVVPQLHLHHVLRRHDDPAWPGPVWGHSPSEPYSAPQAQQVLAELRSALFD